MSSLTEVKMKQSIFEIRIDGNEKIIRTTARSSRQAIANVKLSLTVGSIISGCVKVTRGGIVI